MAHSLIDTVGTSLPTNRADRPRAGWNGQQSVAGPKAFL